MPSLTPNQIETIFRDEAYKAFMTELPIQAEELESQGFFELFSPDMKIDGYSYFETHVFGSEVQDGGRNPGETMKLGTMGQGYQYSTAIRSEFNESRTIADEYLNSVLKLGDYAAKQGSIMARNYFSSYARYFTSLLSLGGIAGATLAATGNGSPGNRPRTRIFAQYLKGQAGAIIAELPENDNADPDGKPWFAFNGNNHIRKNGDTIATFAGKSLGYFNAGGTLGGNLTLSESNISNALLHMQNDLPFGPDRVYYAAPMADTLVVSGNYSTLAREILDLNEYRQNSPNNDKNVMYKSSGVYKLKNVIVNRYLPDNCWFVAAKGCGVHRVMKKGKAMSEGNEGPVPGSVSQIWYDMNTKTWVRDLLCFWSHMFDPDMDICWYGGSVPTTITGGLPVAPTVASLQNWS